MFGIILALAVVAASPGLAALQDADARVAAIAWHLQTANAELCSDTVPLAGFAVQTLAQYQPAVRAAVVAQIGSVRTDAIRQPSVQVVVPDSPADRAGLRRDDIITRINGWPTPRDLPPLASYEATARTQSMIDAGLKSPPLLLEIQRKRLVRTLPITGVTGCASRVEIVTGTDFNAQADGRYVQIFGSLVDFAANDDELAIAIAHELAHNILNHGPRRPETEQGSRGIFAGLKLDRRDAKLRNDELEADRLGVWLVGRAGYDIDAVVPFWMRLGQISVEGGLSNGTHPDWSNRIDRAAAAVAEVKSQRASGAALVPPEFHGKPAAQQSSSQAQFPR